MSLFWIGLPGLISTFALAAFWGCRVAFPQPERLSRHPDWGKYNEGDKFDEELAEWSLKLRTESYLERTKRLANNLRIQTTLVLIATLSVFASPDDEIPLLGIDLTNAILYFILPCAIAFTWLQFGHQLASIIGLRLALWHVLTEIEVNKKIAPESMYSRRSFLELGMFLESWFALFIDKAYLEPTKSIAPFNIISIVPYGILLSLVHGLGFSLLAIFGISLAGGTLSSPAAMAVATFFMLAFSALLFITNYLFYFAAQNKNWFSLLVLGLTPVFATAYTWVAIVLGPVELPQVIEGGEAHASSGVFAAVDLYCERTGPGVFQEPLNTLSNGAFVFAGLFLLPFASRAPERHRLAMCGAALLIVLIGVGSALFHLFANALSEWLDILPIVAFQLLFLWVYTRLGFRRGAGVSAAALGLFLIASAVAVRFPEPLNGSMMYLPAVVALVVISAHSASDARTNRLYMPAATVLFLVSLAARTLDADMCERVGTGTHFVWHVLNAGVLSVSFLTLHELARAGDDTSESAKSG